jgi:hypothetical protein
MSAGHASPIAVRTDDPYALDIEAERLGWYEIAALVRSLTPAECLEPGYQRDPDWTVRDVVGHLGTWLAQAEIEFERMGAGTYEGHEIDVDALNAMFLEAMADQPWEVAWVQAVPVGRGWSRSGRSCANRPMRRPGGSASRASTTTPSTSTA